MIRTGLVLTHQDQLNGMKSYLVEVGTPPVSQYGEVYWRRLDVDIAYGSSGFLAVRRLSAGSMRSVGHLRTTELAAALDAVMDWEARFPGDLTSRVTPSNVQPPTPEDVNR